MSRNGGWNVVQQILDDSVSARKPKNYFGQRLRKSSRLQELEKTLKNIVHLAAVAVTDEAWENAKRNKLGSFSKSSKESRETGVQIRELNPKIERQKK